MATSMVTMDSDQGHLCCRYLWLGQHPCVLRRTCLEKVPSHLTHKTVILSLIFQV